MSVGKIGPNTLPSSLKSEAEATKQNNAPAVKDTMSVARKENDPYSVDLNIFSAPKGPKQVPTDSGCQTSDSGCYTSQSGCYTSQSGCYTSHTGC